MVEDPQVVQFVTSWMMGESIENSYRLAYGIAQSVDVKYRALELKNSPQAVEIHRRLGMKMQEAELTLKEHLEKLAELRDDAHANGKFGPAIQAEVARGRAAGLHTIKHELTINNEEQLSEAEIRARLHKLQSSRERSIENSLIERNTIDAEFIDISGRDPS